ncbi:hypothetical protein BpHYR1_030574 [Brachionus plicatilis]|uniref:Uncharacterized protein n=1 Tax=Brachionus plicatilis TaxID=10195 RepID=A0A3M7SR45_BRAPC|nr:hypothetical protein BpHYR1_030574 [Brachionus plicatilis]
MPKNLGVYIIMRVCISDHRPHFKFGDSCMKMRLIRLDAVLKPNQKSAATVGQKPKILRQCEILYILQYHFYTIRKRS